MKVAHIVCAYPPYKGGMGNSVYNFADVLAREGHKITVFTPDYCVQCAIKKDENIDVVRLKPLLKLGNAAILPQLLWQLKGFNIIHLHYPFFGSVELVMLRKILSGRKVKLIVHYHMDTISKGWKGVIFGFSRVFVLPVLVRLSDTITCASLDYVKHSALSSYYKKHKDKFKQTLFGVDLVRFHPRESKKEKNTKTILFVGSLDKAHYFKGIKNLLKAVSILRSKLSFEIDLNIVGRGDLLDYYKFLAKKYKVEDIVNFADSVEDSVLPEFYNYCDVFVLPSINQGEAFGLVLLEAMASGKPVVASNLPGVRSVFKSGEHGLVVKPNDVDDLVEKLKAILKDDELGQRFGKAGRELIEKKYTWEEVGKRLDLIYHHTNYTPK